MKVTATQSVFRRTAKLAALVAWTLAASGWAETLTPVELLHRMQESYNQIHSYQSVVTLYSRKGSRRENVKLRLTFKKPGMLRARVLAGHGRGSEVAIRNDGRIRGHKGGLLHGITISMKRSDGRLRNIRGEPVWEAEWGAFLPKIRRALDQPSAAATVERGEDSSLVLEVRVTDQGGPERHRYVVDGSTYRLRSAERYEGNTLVSRVVYQEETVNPDLPDGYFSM
jgi:outer membrane lipoprotein-sorting protein